MKFSFLNTHDTKYGYLNKKINKKISKFFYSVNIFLVNKSFLKFITDFGPLLVFFSFYYKNEKDLTVAIPPFIVATLIALAVVWILEKKIPMVPLLGGIFITLFGGLTIYFDNPIFIYVKPTIINILFGIALLFGKFFSNEPILKKCLVNLYN